jgi:hypothetical protein
MKTRKIRGGRLEVIDGVWGFPANTRWGDKTTDDYRGLELKVFIDLRIPITLPNSTEVLRNQVLVQRYRELCAACTDDACYVALNETKKEIRKIIKLRTRAATEHFKEVETEQDEIDRIGHEGRLELWKSNYDPINDAFQELRKRLKKPYEVDTDILANDRLTIREKKGMVTRSLMFVVDDIGSIDKDFSVEPFVELQVDVREIIKNTSELQEYVAGMSEGLLKGLTEIMKRTGEIQTAVAEGDRKTTEMQAKLKDLTFMFEKRLPRVLEVTTAFNEAVRVFSFSNPLPEVNRFSESLEQFIREIEEEMRRSRDMLEARRVKLDGILLQINKEEDELFEEERKETQLHAEEQARLKQEAADARARAKQLHAEEQARLKQERRQKRTHTLQSQDEVIEEEYQLVLQRRAAEEPRRGEPAEEPRRGEPAEEPRRGEPAEDPAERARRAKIYKEKQEENERGMEALQKGYLEQEELIKDATDIADLMRAREEFLRVLETTELTDQERQKKEKVLERNLKIILQKNPAYLDLVKESDKKLKELFKLGMILAELEQYLQDHYADRELAPNDPVPNDPAPNELVPNDPVPNDPVPNDPVPNELTEEERLAQFEADIRGLSKREFLTRLVEKEKLHRDVTEKIETLNKTQTEKRTKLGASVLEFNTFTAPMSEDIKRHIEEWSEVLTLFSDAAEEEKMGVVPRLLAAKEGLSQEPYNLMPVVVNTIERYIIKIYTQKNDITERQQQIDKLLSGQARLTREIEILNRNKVKGGTRRKNRKRYYTRKNKSLTV